MHPHDNANGENLGTSIRRGMRTAEAAAYLGVSRSFLEKARLTGGGPVYAKLGKVVVYSPADLDVWLAARKRRSTSETR